MSNIKDVPVVIALLLFLKIWGLTYGRTDSHVTIKSFEIDGLANLLGMGLRSRVLKV